MPRIATLYAMLAAVQELQPVTASQLAKRWSERKGQGARGFRRPRNPPIYQLAASGSRSQPRRWGYAYVASTRLRFLRRYGLVELAEPPVRPTAPHRYRLTVKGRRLLGALEAVFGPQPGQPIRWRE